MKVEVKLYGALKQFELPFKLNVSSVKEALRALESQSEGFRAYMIESALNGAEYHVLVGSNFISEEQLENPLGKDTIAIIPAIKGSGNVGKIIAGVALIALSFTGVGAAIGLSSASLLLVGGTLALNGIVGLFNKPKAEKTRDKEGRSYIFDGAVNAESDYGIVPVVFGCGHRAEGLIVGSTVVSAAVRTYAVENDDDD